MSSATSPPETPTTLTTPCQAATTRVRFPLYTDTDSDRDSDSGDDETTDQVDTSTWTFRAIVDYGSGRHLPGRAEPDSDPEGAWCDECGERVWDGHECGVVCESPEGYDCDSDDDDEEEEEGDWEEDEDEDE